MMVSFNNDERAMDGEQQEHGEIANRPQTVSSLSSMDTTGYDQSDIGQLDPINQHTALPSLPSLPSLMEASGSSSTVVTTTTTASIADVNFGLTNNTYPAQHEQLSSSPSAITLAGSGVMQISPSTGVLVSSAPNTNTVPEFLYQLTKMLTDNNRDIIEWSNGKSECLKDLFYTSLCVN